MVFMAQVFGGLPAVSIFPPDFVNELLLPRLALPLPAAQVAFVSLPTGLNSFFNDILAPAKLTFFYTS